MLDDNPFFLIYGRDPVLPHDLFLPIQPANKRVISAHDINEYKYKQLQILQKAYEKLNLKKNCEKDAYKKHYDKTHKHVEFNVGEKVMLYTPKTEIGLSTKFLAKWSGPYTVITKVSPVNFRIETENKSKNMVVHVQRLKHYRPWIAPKSYKPAFVSSLATIQE